MPRAVGAFMAVRRRQAGLSRAALAKNIGAGVEEVKWWEESGRLPDMALLSSVADALGTTAEVLQLRSSSLPSEVIEAVAGKLDGWPCAASPDSATYPTVRAAKTDSLPPPALSTELGVLYHGDSTAILPAIESRSIDCIFADPPFNLGKDYGQRVTDERGEQDYLTWCYLWLDELIRLLKPGGSLFLYNLPKWNIHLSAYIDRYLELKHWVAVDIKFSLPIPSRLYPSHYSLLYFVKGSRPRVFTPPRLPLLTCRHCGGEIKDYGGYKDKMNPRGVNLTDVWTDIPPVRHRRYKNRGANELALKMLDRVLDIATDEGDIVLDPFAGSGTTLAACELRSRRWIGVELGDCSPIIGRFESLGDERRQLSKIRAQINVLFTQDALALRMRNGHDNSRYRLSEDAVVEKGGEGRQRGYERSKQLSFTMEETNE